MGGVVDSVFGGGNGGSSSAPAVPDYTAAANATAANNLKAAQAATAANRVNQYTPYGSLNYTQSGTDSQGNPLDASTLPFYVIPLPSHGFDYAAHGIDLGSVGAVIYGGQLEYGIFADQGPQGIIGEASYAMAVALGVDPDPEFGGADSGATYIVFTGADGMVTTNEDHVEAETVGQARAAQLLLDN